MSNVTDALARAKASLASLEAAKQSGSLARIGAARVDALVARQGLLDAKSGDDARDAMIAAMGMSAVHYDLNGITRNANVIKNAASSFVPKALSVDAGKAKGATTFDAEGMEVFR